MQLNPTTTLLFLGFFLLLIGLAAYLSFRQARGLSGFYAAGGNIPPWLNGVAISGEVISVATFLGITGLIFAFGFDGFFYMMGGLAGWPVLVFLIAGPLRRAGKFTFADVMASRLNGRPIRLISGATTVIFVLLYLTAQLVGAGEVLEAVMGLPFLVSVVVVAGLVTAVIATGGMGAATWVQILKAAALLTVGVAMAGMVFWRVGEEGLLESAIAQAPEGKNFLRPGALISDPISGLSLALAFLFGAAGSPHILMRFFTVKDSNRAQISAMVAIFLIAAFLAVTGVLGLGAIALLNGAGAEPIQSSNEVIFQLSHLLGGPELLGIAAGATFATIIAVVSGLVIAGASAVSHDLYTHVLKSGRVDPKREVMVSRAAVGGIMVIAVIISLLFRNQNVGVIATLAITIAASANFPVLAAALYWRGLTTRGALYGSLAGLISSVGLLFLGPNVWVAALGFETPIFPYAYPTLFTLPFAAIVMFCVSWRDGRRADGA